MEDSPEIKLEAKLAELLSERNSSNTAIAHEIGVSPAAITQYRQGETRPSLEKLVELADALGVSLDYLVLGESSEATEINPGPIVKYMDRSFQETQIQTAEHSALVAHVGRRLSEIMSEEIEKYLSSDTDRQHYSGIVTDTETLSLEQHSRKTRLILQKLDYNVSEDSPETPGRFFMTVANNLSNGREYQYLLPENANADWHTIITDFRDLLVAQTNSETAVRNNCDFRVTASPLFAGCGLYQLDEDGLEDEDSILYEFLTKNNYITENGGFGYVAPPSQSGRGDAIMDQDHLSTTTALFEDLWAEAEPI